MNIIAVDTDKSSLANFVGILEKLCPGAQIASFTDPMYAVKYGLEHIIDAVFTEVKLNHLDGLTLIIMLKKRYPAIKPIIVTQSEQYTDKAAKMNVCGYLLKPVDEEQVEVAAMRAGLL